MSPLAPLFATYINPILLGGLVLAPLLPPRPVSPWNFWGRSLFALGGAVALAESGKHWEIWPGHSGFPSGHETFGLCVATSLMRHDRRWLWLGVPGTALLAWALISAHYHSPTDVAGAFLVGPPCALIFYGGKKDTSSRKGPG